MRSMWSRAGSTAGGTRGRAVDEEGRAGVFFLWRSAGRGQAAAGQGVPPIKVEAGLIGSAARYEYVHSPGEHKNKFSPMPQISMQNERKREIVLQTRNKSTYPPPMRELLQKMQRFPKKNKILKF